jgi:hypothetical protein
MSKQFTAKCFVSGQSSNGDGQTSISFTADYADGANKEWAKYTPALSVSMTVLDEVAEGINYGDKCDLLFTFPGIEG